MEQKWTICETKEHTKIPVFIKNSIKKYTENPDSPEEEFIKFLLQTGDKVSILITPICSDVIPSVARRKLPNLKKIIITEIEKERLELWQKHIGNMLDPQLYETVLLPDLAERGISTLEEVLQCFSQDLFLSKSAVYIPERFKRLDKKFCEFLETTILRIQQEYCSAASFRTTRSWHLILNSLINLYFLSTQEHINVLRIPEKNFPIVITGAGPSLHANLQTLKPFRNKVILIATDASLNSLLENNISPDMVVSMEDSSVSWLFFQRYMEKLKDIPLILPINANHVVALHYPGNIVFVKDTIKKNSISVHLADSIPEVTLGNCVGHFAFHIAEALNPSEIILIGFDLALTNGKYHTKAMELQYYEENPKQFQLIEVEGIDGNPVKTELSLFYALKYFETYFHKKENKLPRVVDATFGGAKIHGTEIGALGEILEKKKSINKRFIQDIIIRKEYDNQSFIKRINELGNKISATKNSLINEKQVLKRKQIVNFNPFTNYDTLSPHFNLLLECGNTLLQNRFVDLLSSLSIDKYEEFKQILCEFIDDLICSADFLNVLLMTLKQRFAQDTQTRISGLLKSIIFEIKSSESGSHGYSPKVKLLYLFSSREESENPNTSESLDLLKNVYGFENIHTLPSDIPLPEIWNFIKKNQINCLAIKNGNGIPDIWSVPGIICMDIKTEFNPLSFEKSLWIPGYHIIATDHTVFQMWQKYTKSLVPVYLVKILIRT